MSGTEEQVQQPTDAEIFSSAMADEKVEVETKETQPEPKADATGRLHAQDGKFAPKSKADDTGAAPTQQQPTTDEQTEAKDEGAQVPSWRLRELREQREAADQRAQEAANQAQSMRQQMQALERQLAELQAPKEPVDFFADPNAAIKQSLDPIEQRFANLASNLTLRASRAEAVVVHGRETVSEMEKAIEAAMRSGHPEMPMLAHRMRQSDDPVGEAMQWYQRDKLQKETGGDLTAYKQKLLDEAMKDPAFQAKVIEAARSQASNGSAPKVQLPPSLNKVASAARVTGQEDADMSDAIVNLSAQQAALQAALATGARVIQPQLLDFLR